MNNVKNSAILGTVLVGIFASVLLAAVMAISPSLAKLDATNFIVVKQTQIQVLQIVMSAVSIVYIIAMGYAAYQAKKLGYTTFYKLSIYGLGLVILALLYSAFTDIPYNGQILSWNAATPPTDWAEIRDKWDLSNLVRTFPTMLAFALHCVGLTKLGKKD